MVGFDQPHVASLPKCQTEYECCVDCSPNKCRIYPKAIDVCKARCTVLSTQTTFCSSDTTHSHRFCRIGNESIWNKNDGLPNRSTIGRCRLSQPQSVRHPARAVYSNFWGNSIAPGGTVLSFSRARMPFSSQPSVHRHDERKSQQRCLQSCL